jgi:hypothetical protein
MKRVDSPAPDHLDDALELAEILRPAWPEMQSGLRESGVPLNDGEEEAEAEPGSAEPGAEAPEEDQPAAEEEESFTDSYNPDELSDEARPVYEAAYKKLHADYTKKRMSDAEAVRNAKEAQLIVEGLLDPNRRGSIAEALGLQLAQEEAEEQLLDEFDDPNERIDALQSELARRDELAQATQRMQEENAHVTQQIERLEDDLNLDEIGLPFTDDELGMLYLYAEEFRDAEGNPDVRAAHKVLDSLAANHVRRAAEIRKRAPRRMGNGSAAQRQVDLSTEEARVDAGVRAAQQLLAERSST